MGATAEEYRIPAGIQDTILHQIMTARIPEIVSAKAKFPAESIRMALYRAPKIRSIRSALRRKPGVIAEIKRASPSAGVLRQDFDPVRFAEEYRKAGAVAISVVTEPAFFRGSLETLAALRWKTELPLLRKDFVVDAYQVIEARLAGADAVLLIAGLLDDSSLRELRGCIEELGMDALVEVHEAEELERAVKAGCALIGVNSRDLRTFQTSLDVSLSLAAGLPGDAIAVAESGIRTGEDIVRLARAGYRGFLIGETLMRAESPGQKLSELVSALTRNDHGGLR